MDNLSVLTGIQNVLQFINNNWTAIIIIAGLIVSIGKKILDLFSKSNNEKIEVAKKQIQETMLKLITDAELSYEDIKKSGSIKRSQVIEEIFKKYPILSKVTNQEELIAWIDDVIDNALVTLRDIIKNNKIAE